MNTFLLINDVLKVLIKNAIINDDIRKLNFSVELEFNKYHHDIYCDCLKSVTYKYD